MSGCGCGCGGGHEPGCVHYEALVGTDISSLSGDACGAGASNAPVLSIQCAPLVSLQGVVDLGRRLEASLGGVPYRVFLVWERLQDGGEAWVDVHRVELMPVEVRGLNELLVEYTPSGARFEGEVLLVGISPRQVTQDDLLGRKDGRDWSEDGARFFYEVVQHQLCQGRVEPTRLRFIPKGHPELRTARAPTGFMIRLRDQAVARGRHGEDRSLGVGEVPERGAWDHLRA